MRVCLAWPNLRSFQWETGKTGLWLFGWYKEVVKVWVFKEACHLCFLKGDLITEQKVGFSCPPLPIGKFWMFGDKGKRSFIQKPHSLGECQASGSKPIPSGKPREKPHHSPTPKPKQCPASLFQWHSGFRLPPGVRMCGQHRHWPRDFQDHKVLKMHQPVHCEVGKKRDCLFLPLDLFKLPGWVWPSVQTSIWPGRV